MGHHGYPGASPRKSKKQRRHASGRFAFVACCPLGKVALLCRMAPEREQDY
jgi:hypothetical protein